MKKKEKGATKRKGRTVSMMQMFVQQNQLMLSLISKQADKYSVIV